MSDNTSGVPPPASNSIDESLDEFAAEADSSRIDDSLEEFAAEKTSAPTIAAAPPVRTGPPVPMEPPLAWDATIASTESAFAPKELSAAETGSVAHASDEFPKLRLGELVVRRWIAVMTVAAVVAAPLSVWWTVSRPPVAGEQQTVRRVESASPSSRTKSSSQTNVAESPTADGATSAATDPPAHPGQPASKYASTGTAGVTANESGASPATVGFSPSFAPAVPGMFYHSGTGPASAIMRAETDESGTVVRVSSVVHDRSSNFHARPSPDGQWLAFDSDRDGERGIYLADANGRGIRRVSGAGFASVPSWSPDGRRLAFVRAEARRPRVWNIWTLDLATGDSKRITSHRVGQPWGAAWFPDGKRIAYSHENRLIVRTIDGKDVRIFNSPIRGRLLRTPAVSPDGKQIIFQVHRDGAWMLDVPSGSMAPILKDPSAEEFTWSPDGQRVAYHSRRSGTWSVWVMTPRG